MQQFHKRRHRCHPCTCQGSLASHPKPVCNSGRRSIRCHPSTLPHFSNVTAIPLTAPDHMAPRPAPPIAVPPNLPAPSLRVPSLPPTALSPRVTILPLVFTPNEQHPPALCLLPHTEPHHIQGCLPHHRDLPLSNPTAMTLFLSLVITFVHLPAHLPPTVSMPEPSLVFCRAQPTALTGRKNQRCP